MYAMDKKNYIILFHKIVLIALGEHLICELITRLSAFCIRACRAGDWNRLSFTLVSSALQTQILQLIHGSEGQYNSDPLRLIFKF